MKSKNILTHEQELTSLLINFGNFIKSDEVRKAMRKIPTAFIRRFKFPWYDVLLFLIFRRKECIPSELSNYYSSMGLSHLRISRQAAFNAIKKVDPKVFRILIDRFTERFYQSNLVKTFNGYILLAIDGTTLNLMVSKESLNQFGFSKSNYVKSEESAKKATSRSSAIYDVTNGFIVDYTMKRCIDSEIPIAVEQLYHVAHHFKNREAIVLADRYYDSVELFSILESMNMKYCFRGKRNFFKKYLEQMTSDDEWIDVMIDKTWYR